MNRRDTILALLGLGTAARYLGAIAQSRRADRPFRIGFTSNITPAGWPAMTELMRTLGWTYGRDYVFIESGLPYGPETEEAARRIVAQKPDVIFVVSTAYAVMVHRLTSRTPIVMFSSGYPVEAGVAHSLARPGKNVTGNTVYAGTGIWGKLLQLLREAKPGVKRIGMLWDYLPPAFPHEEIDPAMGELRHDAGALGLEVRLAEVRRPDELATALAGFVAGHVEALLVTTGPVVYPDRSRVTQFAVDTRLPTITDAHWPVPVEPGPMLAYGPTVADLRRQAIGYVDRILRGANPGDLPIQQPAKFELVVNLKTAKAIGLTIPQSILIRADRVIE